VVQFGDGVKLCEFPQGDTLDGRGDGTAFPFLEKFLGFPGGVVADHLARELITLGVTKSSFRFMRFS